MGLSRFTGVLLTPPALFSLAALGLPLAAVLLSSLTASGSGDVSLSNYARLLFDGYYWDVLWTTVRISLITTLSCIVLGYPIAYYLIRLLPFTVLRRLCLILVILPLFTSNVIRSFAWLVILGRTGIVNETLTGAGLLEHPFRFLGSETGIIIGLTYILLPIIVLNVANALAALDPQLEYASADLGASPASTFRLIVLPLTFPSVMSGAITVFALAMSAYVTPAMLSGGKITVFPMLIFQQYSSVLDFHFGAALSVMLLAIAAILTSSARLAASPAEAIR
jgi:putative spermidine/putrescine transport system permease protein